MQPTSPIQSATATSTGTGFVVPLRLHLMLKVHENQAKGFPHLAAGIAELIKRTPQVYQIK
jgi:hypothetical protein